MRFSRRMKARYLANPDAVGGWLVEDADAAVVGSGGRLKSGICQLTSARVEQVSMEMLTFTA